MYREEKTKRIFCLFVLLSVWVYLCLHVICLPVFIIVCYACFIAVIWCYVSNCKHYIYLRVCFMFVFTLFN